MKKTLKKILTYGTLLIGLEIFGCNSKNPYMVEGEVVSENYNKGSLNGFLGDYEEYTFFLKEEGKSQPTKYLIRGNPVDFDLAIDKGDKIKMRVNESDLPGVTTKYHIIEINGRSSNLIGNGHP